MIHVAIDDASRLAFAQVQLDGRGPTAARFLLEAISFFADQGIRVERAMTDRGCSYTLSRDFRGTVDQLHVRHKVTRPYRPQTNDKAERFIQNAPAGIGLCRLYRTNQERRRTFPKWLHYYNHHRPHTALEGSARRARAGCRECQQRLWEPQLLITV